MSGQEERRRLRAPGRRVGTGRHQCLVLVYEANGSWVVQGADARGVRLEAEAMAALCHAVLYCMRQAQGGGR